MNRRRLLGLLAAAGAEVALPRMPQAMEGRPTLFGFVYARNSRLIRRVVFPDRDEHMLDVPGRLMPGEKLRVLPLSYFPPDRRRVRHLQPLIGPALHSGRCCKVNGIGIVEDVIIADPEIDGGIFPRHRLIQSDEAGIGWRWDGERFIDLRVWQV